MIDYLELLLDAQEQEEQEDETPELEARFFSPIASRVQTTAANMETAEKDSKIKGNGLEDGTAKTKTVELKTDEIGKSVPWANKTGTSRLQTERADLGAFMAVGSGSMNAETAEGEAAEDWAAEARMAEGETDTAWVAGAGPKKAGTETVWAADTRTEKAGTGQVWTLGEEVAGIGMDTAPVRIKAVGAWAVGAGRADPNADTPDTNVPKTVETESTEFGLAKAGTASARIAGLFAAVRGQSEVLSDTGDGTSTSGAASLYRRMAQAGQAVGSLRQNARLLTVAENSSAAPSPGAAELDEIFSRDARRYDSGFTLF